MKAFAAGLLLICFLGVSPYAEEYEPPPEPERPLLEFDPKPANQIPGIIVSVIGLGGGATMIAMGLRMSVKSIGLGLDSPAFQGGLMMSAGGLVVSAVMSLGLERFTASLKDLRQSRRSGSR